MSTIALNSAIIQPGFFKRIWLKVCDFLGFSAGPAIPKLTEAELKNLHAPKSYSHSAAVRDGFLNLVGKVGSPFDAAKKSFRERFYVGYYGKVPLTKEKLQEGLAQQKISKPIQEFPIKTYGPEGQERELKAFQIGGRGPVLFFTGINSSGASKINGAAGLAKNNIGSMISNYYGFGSTVGEPFTERTLIEDAKALILELQRRASDSRVTIISHSMGSAIASAALAELSENKQINKDINLVICSGWDSFNTVANYHGKRWSLSMPGIARLVKNIFHDYWETGNNLTQLVNNFHKQGRKIRIQIYHGAKDDIVPLDNSKNLHNKLSGNLEVNPRLSNTVKIDEPYILPEERHFSTHRDHSQLPYGLFMKNLAI